MTMATVNTKNLIIDPLDLRGLDLIRVFSKHTGKIILFGTYKGNYSGNLIVPPDTTLTTEVVAEAHQALLVLYPEAVWSLYPNENSQNYKDIEKSFQDAGVSTKATSSTQG